MTADELARESAARMAAGDAASLLMGIDVRDVGPGCATAAMTVRSDMVNGWGTCHGGLVATLADTAFAFACNSHGRVTVAAGFEIELLEPARVGDVLVATATERWRGGRAGIYDVTVRRGDTVIAEFRGRSRTLREA